MDRLYEAAALAFGMLTLALLTVIAMWLGDRDAVRLMVGCVLAAYLCQVCGAVYERNAERNVQFAGLLFWFLAAALGAWAAVVMVW